jgi:hypothetical protein
MTRSAGGTAELEVGLPSDPVPMKVLHTALARAVASYKVSDQVIKGVAEKLAGLDVRIRGLDICAYGICIDFFTTDDRWPEKLSQFLRIERSYPHRIEVLVNGIPYPDLFHVRVEQHFEELGRLAGMPGH